MKKCQHCGKEAKLKYCDECIEKDRQTLAEIEVLFADLEEKEDRYRRLFGEIPPLSSNHKE